MLNYETSLKILYKLNRTSKFKFNLHQVKKLADLVGNPQKKLLTIHVSGTNGKGSITHAMSKLLSSNSFNILYNFTILKEQDK